MAEFESDLIKSRTRDAIAAAAAASKMKAVSTNSHRKSVHTCSTSTTGQLTIETLCKKTGLKRSAVYANVELARTERESKTRPIADRPQSIRHRPKSARLRLVDAQPHSSLPQCEHASRVPHGQIAPRHCDCVPTTRAVPNPGGLRWVVSIAEALRCACARSRDCDFEVFRIRVHALEVVVPASAPAVPGTTTAAANARPAASSRSW